MAIYILVRNFFDEEIYLYHSETSFSEEHKNFGDGYYSTYTITFVSKPTAMYQYSYVNGQLYKSIDGGPTETADIEELIYIKTDVANIQRNGGKSSLDDSVVYYDNLYACYINILQQILLQCNMRCYNKLNKELLEDRDILFMLIEVLNYIITYLDHSVTHQNQAGDLLNKFLVCNNICDKYNSNNKPTKCGCYGRKG